jgi:hypothetical protein
MPYRLRVNQELPDAIRQEITTVFEEPGRFFGPGEGECSVLPV